MEDSEFDEIILREKAIREWNKLLEFITERLVHKDCINPIQAELEKFIDEFYVAKIKLINESDNLQQRQDTGN